MDIDVFSHQSVRSPSLYKLLAPHLPGMKAALDRRFGHEPLVKNSLDWVFLRKYVSGHQRDGLLGHHDTNLHTINVPLNLNFKGGSLYFVPDNSELGRILSARDLRPDDQYDKAKPFLTDNNVDDKCNTSDYFFPHLKVGAATVYNNKVWHGVSKMRAGSRYTLSLFYDQPSTSTEPSTDAESSTNVLFINQRPDRVGEQLSLFWVPQRSFLIGTGPRMTAPGATLIHNEFSFGAKTEEETYVGHIFCVKDQDGLVLKVWEVQQQQQHFVLTDEAAPLEGTSKQDRMERGCFGRATCGGADSSPRQYEFSRRRLQWWQPHP